MSEQSHVISGIEASPKIVKEHKEFVQDLVGYFKQSAGLDNGWQTKWLATIDNDKNGDSYLNF